MLWKLWRVSLGPASNVVETWMVDLSILLPNQHPLLDRSSSVVGASGSFAAWVFPLSSSLSSCSWIQAQGVSRLFEFSSALW